MKQTMLAALIAASLTGCNTLDGGMKSAARLNCDSTGVVETMPRCPGANPITTDWNQPANALPAPVTCTSDGFVTSCI